MKKDVAFNGMITGLKYFFEACIWIGIISIFIQDAKTYTEITISAISDVFS